MYLRHPDKPASLNYSSTAIPSYQQDVINILNNPPKEAEKYSTHIEGLPKLEDSDIFQYFLVKCDNTQSTAAKHRDKGWNFYKSGKVVKVVVCQKVAPTISLIKSEVIASFDRGNLPGKKTKRKYPVLVCIESTAGTVLEGKCDCKAGAGGFCKHVAATLFAVFDHKDRVTNSWNMEQHKQKNYRPGTNHL